MSGRAASWIAWSTCGLTLVMIACAVTLGVPNRYGLGAVLFSAGGHQVISEAPRVEQLQRSGVHGERAGEIGLLATALQYRAVEAGSGKVAGQH